MEKRERKEEGGEERGEVVVVGGGFHMVDNLQVSEISLSNSRT